MKERTRRGLDVLQAALILGLVGDLLLRATPWGLNALLWMLLAVAAGLMLIVRWRRNLLSSAGRWVAWPLIFFAACFVWRDSPTLKLIDGIGILLGLSLAILRTRAASIQLASLKEYGIALSLSVFDAMLGLPTLLLGDVDWKEVPHTRLRRAAGAVTRGLLIAVPLIVLFGALLMAADAVFEGLINNAFNIDGEILWSHLGLTVLFSWVAGGFLRGVLDERDAVLANSSDSGVLALNLEETKAEDGAEGGVQEKAETAPQHKPLSLGIVEVGVVLGLLDLLFLAFVTVQIRYFFGGAALVQQTTGLTYSEYARRGFFELVWVAALVLPLLLIAHWLLRKENPVHERIFRVLAGGQVALLFVIMASAVQRVRLYQREYGLTEQRLYTMALIAWLCAVFVWFVWTVLRGARERFATGAVVMAFVIAGLLHVANPTALIVRANISHAQNLGRGFDAEYAAGLSADAAPALAASLPAMTRDERCVVAQSLLKRWLEENGTDWRTWNMSRSQARKLVRENEEALRAIASCSRVESQTQTPTDTIVQNDKKE